MIFFLKDKTQPRLPKTPHSNTPHKSMSLCCKICMTPPRCIRKQRRHNFYSRCSIVAATAMAWRCCVFPNMVRGVTFPSHAWGIRPITMHWIAGQSEHTMSFSTMRFEKTGAFQKVGAERSNTHFGEWFAGRVGSYAFKAILLLLASPKSPTLPLSPN